MSARTAKKRVNPHAELCAWANGLRDDSPKYEPDHEDDPETVGTCGSCGAAIDLKDDVTFGCWYCGEDL